MKISIQIVSTIVASLVLGSAITFASAPQAEVLAESPYQYWYMLGKYQGIAQ